MAITNAQQYKQLVNPPMKGNKRPGYRGEAAAASDAAAGRDAGRDTSAAGTGDRGDGKATGAQSRGVLEAKQAFKAAQKGLTKSLTQQSRQAAFDKLKGFLPGGKYSLIGMGTRALGNIFGGTKFGKTTAANLANRYGYGPDYQGTKGPSSIDDDDDTGGGEDIPLYARLGFPSQAAYLASLQPQAPVGLPAAVQPMQTMDLNRIAYRLMADGGFLGEEDEPRQAYGLGSLVKKVVKKATTLPRKLVKTVKKVAKSPTGRLLLAVAAPYALGPAMAGNAAFLSSLSAAQKAALVSGATTGITQLASGEDLDLKDIALSAAIGGGTAKMFPGNIPGKAQATPFERQAFSAAQTQGLGSTGLDPSTLASRARVASDVTPKNTSFLRDSFMGSRGKNIVDAVSTPATESTGILQTIKDLGTKAKDSKLTDILLKGDDGKISPTKSILLASALSGLVAEKDQEPDEFSEMDRGEGIDIAAIRRRPFAYMAPRFAGSEFDFYAAEGGQAKKEPVAKKVMPLLDMGGMEKDYRKDGGFVPIGRMEKADDVPARLSKNEFVFTADAVRNAGDGNVDKGAEVMYNMMKNLEAGGDVSEESQGLKGARKMFQTSQRLEEVL